MLYECGLGKKDKEFQPADPNTERRPGPCPKDGVIPVHLSGLSQTQMFELHMDHFLTIFWFNDFLKN